MLTVVALGVNTEALEDGETTQSLKAINLLQLDANNLNFQGLTLKAKSHSHFSKSGLGPFL